MGATQKIIDRITKLLRMARDLGDEPYGKTSQKIADQLMHRHGVRVELEDEYESASKSAMLAESEEPVAWKEYLANGLAAIYRCGLVPQRFGIKWQVWIFADEPERVSTCRDHYLFLAEQIKNRRLRTLQNLQRWTPDDDSEELANALAMGLVQGAMERILLMFGYTGPTPFEEGFDRERFEQTVPDPFEVEYQETDETGMVRYVHRAAAERPEHLCGGIPPQTQPLAPDEKWFDAGIRDARFLHLIPSRLADAFTDTWQRHRHRRS